MNKIRVVVVDDSPFSVAMLTNILTENGFNVVGSANSMDEAIEVVNEHKPDVVTMDITMPGGDGIECTKAIHKTNPNVKVVIVSSMMDEEIIHSAKKARTSGFVQKPVDAEELTLTIRRIMADEEVFLELDKLYYTAFKEALCDTFNRFFKAVPHCTLCEITSDEQPSLGMSVVMGIIGRYGGRMIFDMSDETAKRFTGLLLKKDNPSHTDMISVLGEIANIIAGNACSFLNKSNILFGLRVAPPTVVYGESIKISKSELDTVTSLSANTVLGEVCMNIGFNRGECS